MPSNPSAPHPLLASARESNELKASARDWPSWDLDSTSLAMAELLLNGTLSPIRGFGLGDCGAIPPLKVDPGFAATLEAGTQVALRDPEGEIIAALSVTEADATFGRISGTLIGLTLPKHYDSHDLRLAPSQFEFASGEMIAYFTRHPIHCREANALLEIANDRDAKIIVFGTTQTSSAGDEAGYALIRCWRHAVSRMGESARLVVLPPAIGESDTPLHKVVAQNFGCRLIAGLPNDGDAESGMCGVIKFIQIEGAGVDEDRRAINDSLISGSPMPDGTTFPEVELELRRAHPALAAQGLTVFFTGLSGSGKSTIARALLSQLMEIGGRRISLLDGDLVRKNLSSELSFSREHRNINILRIGYVAEEITKHGGIAICAPIAPFDEIRKQVRAGISRWGGFILIHVATPLEVCEARDRKGLYAKARAGIIPEFTGISDPFEIPKDAEVKIQTEDHSAEEAASSIVQELFRRGYLNQSSGSPC